MTIQDLSKYVSRITSRAWPVANDPRKVAFMRDVSEAVRSGRLCREDFELSGRMTPKAAVSFIRGRIRGGGIVAAIGGRGGEVLPRVSD